MPDMEKTVKALQKIHTHLWVKYRGCGIKAEKAKYQERLSAIEDAIALLKEQEEKIYSVKEIAMDESTNATWREDYEAWEVLDRIVQKLR